MFNTDNIHVRITYAGLAGAIFMLASDPQVQALLMPPWGMLMAKASAAVVAAGVFYGMNPSDSPKLPTPPAK